MKNLFVLPTDKPSRLFVYDGKLGLAKESQYGSNAIQNHKIYITNEEKTKYGDWCIDLDSYFVFKFATNHNHKRVKKIILTTHQKLINYNIQAIPDEFLEWFVKNPSCEEVEVKCYSKFNDGDFTDYKIIIPKEEPKQETLEEASYNYAKDKVNRTSHLIGFRKGAKWQQERMYSEEEVINFNLKYLQELGKHQSENGKWMNFKEWFELNKKK